MPDAETLRKQLRSISFIYFAQATNIVSQLANQAIEAAEVVNILDLAITNYNRTSKIQLLKYFLQIKRDTIIRTLLQYSPEAIKDLEGRGLIKA